MVDDQLARWIARLPLSEQLLIRRHDEQADTFNEARSPRGGRSRLKPKPKGNEPRQPKLRSV